MAGLAQTACTRCREQKLRCSRELPSCERCTRLSARCVFPTPPDRKMLARARANSRKQKRQSHNFISSAGASSVLGPPPEPLSGLGGESIDAPDPGDPTLTPELQRFLQDVYFTCTFNSPLVFHRPTFDAQFAIGSLPQHNSHAIAAMATNFQPVFFSFDSDVAAKIEALGDLNLLGERWATKAGQSVLQSIDRPSLPAIQTCQVLALYWFSKGDPQRNAMFSGIALRGARALLQDVGREAPSWLSEEMLRRCFWGSWMSNCINADHYIVGSSNDSFVMNLALPISETAYNEEVEENSVTLLDVFDSPQLLAQKRATSHPNIMLEIMTLILFWSKVRDLLELRKRSSGTDSMIELLALDEQLSTWAYGMTTTWEYSKRKLYEQLIVKQQLLYTVLHSVYHQCRLVLHCSIIPQFSGVALSDETPPEAIKLSTHIALKSAQSISQLATDLLALEWDAAQLPPFLGYCMYVSATIHLHFIFSSNAFLAEGSKKSLLASLKILRVMRRYWANLDNLWARAHLLYEAQLSKERQPKLMSESPAHQIATMEPDTRRLTEPLADSVLEYSLQNLRQRIDLREYEYTAHSLEQAMSDGLQTIMPFTLKADPTPTYPSPQTATNAANTSPSQRHAPPSPWSSSPDSIDKLFDDGSIDWSQFDHEALNQPFLAFGDFIATDDVVPVDLNMPAVVQ